MVDIESTKNSKMECKQLIKNMTTVNRIAVQKMQRCKMSLESGKTITKQRLDGPVMELC